MHIVEGWSAFDSPRNTAMSLIFVLLQYFGPGMIKSVLRPRTGNAWVHAVSYHSIAPAADDVCRIMDHGDLWSKTLFSRCVRQAITDAVAGVYQPALYSVYAMKNSTLRPIVLAARQSR
jgi:hypothetical protein